MSPEILCGPALRGGRSVKPLSLICVGCSASTHCCALLRCDRHPLCGCFLVSARTLFGQAAKMKDERHQQCTMPAHGGKHGPPTYLWKSPRLGFPCANEGIVCFEAAAKWRAILNHFASAFLAFAWCTKMSRRASISVLEPPEGTLLVARRNAQASESDWAQVHLWVKVRKKCRSLFITLCWRLTRKDLR